MNYQLPTLSFEYDELEPFIDKQTMKIHHSKHHQGYVNKLNNAIKGTSYQGQPIGEIIASASELPDGLRNNGGGHYNHSLFWNILAPGGTGHPGDALSEAIDHSFGSFDAFKNQFADAAAGQFGSGWAWLIATKQTKELAITSTTNQDNPLMDVADLQGIPLLGLDVWEHAYYLNYQNKRGHYIDAFWEIVNWQAVEANYEKAAKEPWHKLLAYTTAAFHNDRITT